MSKTDSPGILCYRGYEGGGPEKGTPDAAEGQLEADEGDLARDADQTVPSAQ